MGFSSLQQRIALSVFLYSGLSQAAFLDDFIVGEYQVLEKTKMVSRSAEMNATRSCCRDGSACKIAQAKVRSTAKTFSPTQEMSAADLFGEGTNPQVAFLGESHGGLSITGTRKLMERLHKRNEGPDCYFIETPGGIGEIVNSLMSHTVTRKRAVKDLAAAICVYQRNVYPDVECPSAQQIESFMGDMLDLAEAGLANGLKKIRGIDIDSKTPGAIQSLQERNQAMSKTIQESLKSGECKFVFVQNGLTHVVVDDAKDRLVSTPTLLEKENIRTSRLFMADAGSLAAKSVKGCDWSEFIPNGQLQVVPDFQNIPKAFEGYEDEKTKDGIISKPYPPIRAVLIGTD